jgi:hypothetical protein
MKSRLEALVSEMVERGIQLEDAVHEFEKHFILSVLKRTNGTIESRRRASASSQYAFKTSGKVLSERPHGWGAPSQAGRAKGRHAPSGAPRQSPARS